MSTRSYLIRGSLNQSEISAAEAAGGVSTDHVDGQSVGRVVAVN